jgi:hypothetical protein
MERTLMRLLHLLCVTLLSAAAEIFPGFNQSTLLITENGLKKIEDITTEDKVISSKSEQLLISKLFYKKSVIQKNCIVIIVDHEEIIASAKQKFYVDSDWKKADQLQIGDQLRTIEGTFLPIQRIYKITSDIEIFDISVVPAHTYFVSQHKILVHNLDPITIGFVFAFGEGIIEFIGINLGLAAFGIGLKICKDFHDSDKDRCILIDEKSEEKGSKIKEEKLPSKGDYPFIPKKTKDAKIPKDRNGGFIDKHGNSWIWDPKKEEWDVQLDGGKRHRNVNKDGMITH